MSEQDSPDTPRSPPEQTDALGLAVKALSVLRHDIRNLLASVTIVADRMATSDDPRLVSAAPMLVASMERAVELGTKAGRLVEAAPGETQSVALRAVLLRAKGDGAAVIDVAEDVMVRADPGHVATICEELIGNAAHLGAPTTVTAASGASDNQVEVLFADQGPGIPDYAQATIFTPFKGAKRREGTGLGLPLAARLAAMNSGSLTLKETGDAGTVFVLALPRA